METRTMVISKEYLERIRMFAAIRPDESFYYVPIAYRELPVDMRPKFKLRPVDGESLLQYSDGMKGEVTFDGDRQVVNFKRGEFVAAVCRHGIQGWENYYDLRGNVVEFKGDIKSIPASLLDELSEAITTNNQLSNEEELGLK